MPDVIDTIVDTDTLIETEPAPEIATEVKAMGAAWFKGNPSPNISNGTEMMPPPAPVSPMSEPTNNPMKTGVKKIICIIYIIH